MNKIIAIVIVIAGLIIAGVFGGYQWSEADNANEVARLNKLIYDAGVDLQNKTNTEAEANRQLKIANRGRSDAIKLNDHNTKAAKQLQYNLDILAKELRKTRVDHARYIVLNVNAVKRVYDDARNACGGLPDSNDSPIVSAQLREFTGDSITRVVRDLTGRYCSVATDYNSLYATCETLLTGIKKPAR